MDMSFWTGVTGARAAQQKLDIVSNNLANVNNNGYKAKNASFSELVRYNLNAPEQENTTLSTANGAALGSAQTDFSGAALQSTGRSMDYALTDANTFFRVRNQSTGEVLLTRDGHFHAGEMANGRFALMTDSNQVVLNTQGQPVYLRRAAGAEEGTLDAGQRIGICTVPFPTRLQNVGDDAYMVRAGDTNNPITIAQNAGMQQGALESSGTDVAKEMTNVIEAQRAFSYNIRMITTSDEVMSTINSLHN